MKIASLILALISISFISSNLSHHRYFNNHRLDDHYYLYGNNYYNSYYNNHQHHLLRCPNDKCYKGSYGTVYNYDMFYDGNNVYNERFPKYRRDLWW